MARSTVHYADNKTNNILKRLHNKLRPAGTPAQRVEYIIELLLLRIFEIKLRHEKEFKPLRKLFEENNYKFLFSYLQSLTGEQIKAHLNSVIFPFYGRILAEARKVFKDENLPQKVQDHLVLVEEVFANSSFTTNVQSGNMHEIIGLVAEIDENTILKTDILGDAIESALSETGGTQDIGLYRTPDHIRQMMVAMADPTFEDTIYDPACGTGGFLFDAYHYVLEKVTKDGKWPSPKCPPSHPELNKYFKKYFQQFDEPMPDIDTANKFYREGVGGTEYLGMIRKMAAINLYIRGLNPANIRQGDSLALFDPALDSESKTCILSNPPFGAERDQPAYPNVWKDFAKESETTILFVKLMLDMLKKGGRCVVVVSEGFLTWDKASARTLRKKLLEEANLRAIISLPQGVFVSKLGQGAKTSILYFEKGEPTKWVWYYKIENDGFSMGVNRKPIPGSQLPEVIELFTKYVKKGKIPSETKYSFVIPAEWIKTLDPRLKERIKKETREKIILRERPKLEKKIEQLKEKLQKGKITKSQFEQKKKQLELTLENRIQNRIAKELEKAHQYSFNLRTYRSDLSKEQIKEWVNILGKKKVLAANGKGEFREEYWGIESIKWKDLEKKYVALLKQPNTEMSALQILASFDPRHALEIEIAREYLLRQDQNFADDRLINLKKLLKQKTKYPRVRLENLIQPKYDKIRKDDYKGDYEIIQRIDFSKGQIHFREKKETGMDLYKASKGDLITSKINLWQGAISIAPCELVCSTHYQVYSINKELILPEYLFFILRSKNFLQPIAEERNQGIKTEQGPKFLLRFSIPLPPLDVQKQIVEKIEKQKSIIQGAEKILEGWEVDENLFKNYPKVQLEDVCVLITDGTHKTPTYVERGIKFLSATNVSGHILDLENVKYIPPSLHEEFKRRVLPRENDILLAKNGTIGACKIVPKLDYEFSIYVSLALLRPNKEKIIPKFLLYVLQSRLAQKQFRKRTKRHGGVGNLHLEEIRKVVIPLPPLDVQRKIVEELDKEMEALEKVRILKEKAEKRIEQILEEVWGEENNR